MQTDLREQLHRRSTADEVADLLRRLIFSNELATGDPLTESRLAPRMGVSRQVVREAVFRLESDGLVERIPYRGAVVKRITTASVAELYAVRDVLELAAAAAAQPDCGSRLMDSVDAMRSMHDDWRSVINADFEFHATLISELKSVRLDGYYATLQGELRLCLALTNHGQYTPDDFVNSHRDIARAISEGHPEQARDLLKKHLDLSRADVETALDLRAAKAAKKS